jgi:hypothetical protein
MVCFASTANAFVKGGLEHITFPLEVIVATLNAVPKTHCFISTISSIEPHTVTLVPPSTGPKLGVKERTNGTTGDDSQTKPE